MLGDFGRISRGTSENEKAQASSFLPEEGLSFHDRRGERFGDLIPGPRTPLERRCFPNDDQFAPTQRHHKIFIVLKTPNAIARMQFRRTLGRGSEPYSNGIREP